MWLNYTFTPTILCFTPAKAHNALIVQCIFFEFLCNFSFHITYRLLYPIL